MVFLNGLFKGLETFMISSKRSASLLGLLPDSQRGFFCRIRGVVMILSRAVWGFYGLFLFDLGAPFVGCLVR